MDHSKHVALIPVLIMTRPHDWAMEPTWAVVSRNPKLTSDVTIGRLYLQPDLCLCLPTAMLSRESSNEQ